MELVELAKLIKFLARTLFSQGLGNWNELCWLQLEFAFRI